MAVGRRAKASASAAGVTCAILLACSQKLELPPAANEGKITPGGSGSGTGFSVDGATDVGDGGLCTLLENGATFTDIQSIVGSPEQGVGGVIVDGTYFLTGVTLYTSSTSLPQTVTALRSTIRITSSVSLIEEVTDTQGTTGTVSTNDAFSYTAGGATLNVTGTCGPAETVPYSYTATPMQLTLVNFTTLESRIYQLQTSP